MGKSLDREKMRAYQRARRQRMNSTHPDKNYFESTYESLLSKNPIALRRQVALKQIWRGFA